MSKLQKISAVDIVTCNICKKYLKNPVLLPCGETICNQHVDLKKSENAENYSVYKCQICKENHYAYDEAFSSNKIAINLLIFCIFCISFIKSSVLFPLYLIFE